MVGFFLHFLQQKALIEWLSNRPPLEAVVRAAQGRPGRLDAVPQQSPKIRGSLLQGKRKMMLGMGLGLGNGVAAWYLHAFQRGKMERLGKKSLVLSGLWGGSGFPCFFAELRLPEPQDPWEGKTVEWQE